MFNFVDIFTLMIVLNRIPFDKQLIWLFILLPPLFQRSETRSHKHDRTKRESLSFSLTWSNLRAMWCCWNNEANSHCWTYMVGPFTPSVRVHVFLLKPFSWTGVLATIWLEHGSEWAKACKSKLVRLKHREWQRKSEWDKTKINYQRLWHKDIT